MKYQNNTYFIKSIILRLFLILCACLVIGYDGVAIEFKSIEKAPFIVQTNQIITNELWLAASAIIIDGTATDDLFLLGTVGVFPNDRSATNSNGVIQISGLCQNDVWALANSVVITGSIVEHTRAIATDAKFGGIFGKSVIVLSSTLNSDSNAVFNGDCLFFGNYVIANGTFAKKVKIVCQQVTLSGVFSGDVEIVASDIVVQPSAEFKGRILYTAPSEIKLSKEQLARMPDPPVRVMETIKKQERSLFAENQLWLFFMFMGAIPCAWLLNKMFPELAMRAISNLLNSFWLSVAPKAKVISLFSDAVR